MTGGSGRHERTAAFVVRAGPATSHLLLPAWMHDQITVAVPTDELTAATGLNHCDLPCTELTVTADLTATTDTDVAPRDVQLPAQRRLQAA